MPSATLGLLFGVWLMQQQAYWCPWWILALAAVGLSLLGLIVFIPLKPRLSGWLKRVCQHGLLCCCLVWLGFAMAQARAQWRLSDALSEACAQQPLQVQVLITGLPEVDALGQHVDALIEQVYTRQCRLSADVPRQVRLHLYQARFAAHQGSSKQSQHTKADRKQPASASVLKPTQAPTHLTASPSLQTSKVTVHPSESLAAPMPRFTAGSRWRLTVKLKRPHATRNPHGFDYAAWCLANQIGAMGTVVHKAPMLQISPFVWRLDTLISQARSHVGARITHVLGQSPESAVIRALVIGDDSQLKRAEWQLFIDSGINHLISISGLHITMLAAIGYWLVRRVWQLLPALGIWLPAHLAASFGGVVVAVGYAALAGFSIPTQRTLYMLLTIAALLHLKRPLPLSWILSSAVWVVVWLDPWSVMAPGFWLSFGAVACLSFAMGGRVGRQSGWRQALTAQWVMTLGFFHF